MQMDRRNLRNLTILDLCDYIDVDDIARELESLAVNARNMVLRIDFAKEYEGIDEQSIQAMKIAKERLFNVM